jgi:hypothetical protein
MATIYRWPHQISIDLMHWRPAIYEFCWRAADIVQDSVLNVMSVCKCWITFVNVYTLHVTICSLWDSATVSKHVQYSSSLWRKSMWWKAFRGQKNSRSPSKSRKSRVGSSLNRQNVIRTSVPVSNAVSCARRDLIEKGVHVMESTPQIARIKLNP